MNYSPLLLVLLLVGIVVLSVLGGDVSQRQASQTIQKLSDSPHEECKELDAVVVESFQSDPFARPASSPGTGGIDPGMVQEMMNVIDAQNANPASTDTIDSVIIIRSGNVVLEEYPNPSYTVDSLHQLFSVTKSIMSLLVGIAADQKLIGNVEDSILLYFPQTILPEDVPSKSAILIEHVLSMSAGLEWDEDTLPTSDPRNDFTRLERSSDSIRFVLSKPLIEIPGTLFWYNTGLSHVLSALIAKTSGQSTFEFARTNLFDPLGITAVRWNCDRSGIHFGGTQLYLRPRDLARIGVLCLNGGVWDGEEVVSSEWIETSTATRISGREDYFSGRGYAFQWWTVDDYGVYYASGSQGQCMFIFPELELLVVFTATIQEGDISPEILVRDYILPAVQAGIQ